MSRLRETHTQHQPASDKAALMCATFHGEGQLVAAAIHHGHAVRKEVFELLALDEETRLREEDPYTGLLTEAAPTRLIGLRSRFEVDLNRPRDKAVYQTPEDAWGLKVWRTKLPQPVIDYSLAEYDAFYAHVHRVLSLVCARHGYFVVLDLHSYNHRRAGPDAPPADPIDNPVVNIGTGSVDRLRWGGVIDRFIDRMRSATVAGKALDVRENVKFQGGYFPAWINETFTGRGMALAIEFKKVFMDEWSGECNYPVLRELRNALELAAGAVEFAEAG